MHQNIDSEYLTNDLKRFLNSIQERTYVDKEFFYSIQLFFLKYLENSTITQEHLHEISSTYSVKNIHHENKSLLIGSSVDNLAIV